MQEETEKNIESPVDKFIASVLYFTIITCGIGVVLNSLCLVKLARLKSPHNRAVLQGIAWANLMSIVIVLLQCATEVFEYNFPYISVWCKLEVFLSNTSSAFAMWCWLVLAGMRFFAVFSPYLHIRLKDNDFRLIVGVFVLGVCILVECWPFFLIDVISMEQLNYSENDTINNGTSTLICYYNKKLISMDQLNIVNFVEMIASYFVPFFIILNLDICVFVRVYLWQPQSDNDVGRRIVLKSGNHELTTKKRDSSETTMLSNNHVGSENNTCSKSESITHRHGFNTVTIISSTYEKVFRLRKNRTFARLIWLTLMNLILNLPMYVVRVLNMCYENGSWLPSPYNTIVQKVSFALSYLHYAVNYVYSTVLIDDSSKAVNRRRPATVSSGAIGRHNRRAAPRESRTDNNYQHLHIGSDI